MGNGDGVLFARLGNHMTACVAVQSRCFCLVLSLVDSFFRLSLKKMPAVCRCPSWKRCCG